MSQEKGYLSNDNRKKVTTSKLLEMKQNGEKSSFNMKIKTYILSV